MSTTCGLTLQLSCTFTTLHKHLDVHVVYVYTQGCTVVMHVHVHVHGHGHVHGSSLLLTVPKKQGSGLVTATCGIPTGDCVPAPRGYYRVIVKSLTQLASTGLCRICTTGKLSDFQIWKSMFKSTYLHQYHTASYTEWQTSALSIDAGTDAIVLYNH